MLRDPEEKERQFLQDTLGPSAGNVLEIGCGDGRLTAGIMNISDKVLALDPDHDSIEKARHLMERRVKLLLGSGESLPLHDDTFDTVVFSLSLHHHQDPENALTQARRVLKKGGRILVLEPDAQGPVNRLFKLIHNEDDAYERAEAAIRTSRLETIDHGRYETTWRFEDFDEMVRHLFGHFDKEPDRETSDRMELLLGEQSDLKPLDILDIMRYWLLEAGTGMVPSP